VEHAKKFYSEENHSWPEARDFLSVTGHGVKANISDKSVIVGNKSFMLSLGIDIPVEASEILMEEEDNAQTGIIVAMDEEVVGIIAVSDPIKPNAHEVISYLKSMKVECIMVTGDNWGTAKAIGREVGIENIMAEAKPEHKAEKVKELQVSSSCFISKCYLSSLFLSLSCCCRTDMHASTHRL
jgi:Cu+-exporting ATPase